MGSSGSSGGAEFIEVLPGGRRVRPGLRVHWGAPWDSSGSSAVGGLIGMRPGCRRVRPGSLGSLGCALWVVGFIRVNCGAPWGSSCSFAVA